MDEDVVTTKVDDLIEYLEGKDKVSIKDAAKDLKITEETLQLWVDFLVEERIIGTEYKFTKPYIYLNRKTKKKASTVATKKHTYETFRNDYIENAKKKKIPEDQARQLWEQHVTEAIDKQEKYFYKEAKKRGLNNPEELFGVYKRNVLSNQRGETQ